MRTTIRAASATAATAALALAATTAPTAAGTSRAAVTPVTVTSTGTTMPAPVAIGLGVDGETLYRFRVDAPGHARRLGAVEGLTVDTRLVGIDRRVQNRRLYGVGDHGGVYTINVRHRRAAKVSQLTAPLLGTHFGVDFNPAADRLRVISDAGQNLRHDVNPGGTTTVDGMLNYPPDMPRAEGVTAAAYTNNDLDATTSTTLFDVDTALDQGAIQAPANAGSLSATGRLGINAAPNTGADTWTGLEDGKAAANRGFVTLRPVGSHRFALYAMNLLTGELSRRGHFPRGMRVADLAVDLDQG
ncbi:MAG: DUF4394 domain-containing protein [Actinomycetota bacterium]|nr:DUF4394 domain-containing protein [Actinomycetota bacterium]